MEVKGDTKDDYLNKSWFGPIFLGVYAWYKRRYGDALQGKSSYASAVIFAFDTPFRAEVPLFINEPILPGKEFWLCFPVDVKPHEDHMAWIVNPPNFDSSTVEERSTVSSALTETASQLRATHVNLMTARHETERARSLAGGILPGLEKGALDIARAEPNGLSTAVWELNFSCERAIKTFLTHKDVEPPYTHDVHRLHRLATDRFGPSELGCDAAVEQLLQGRSAELLLDPWAGLGQLAEAAKAATGASNTEALVIEQEMAGMGHLFNPSLTRIVGEPLVRIRKIDEPLNVVVSVLPAGMSDNDQSPLIGIDGQPVRLRGDYAERLMIESAQRLRDDGIALFVVQNAFFYHNRSAFQHLEKFGLWVHAAFALPARTFMHSPGPSSGYLIVISKNKPSKLFIAQLTDEEESNR